MTIIAQKGQNKGRQGVYSLEKAREKYVFFVP